MSVSPKTSLAYCIHCGVQLSFPNGAPCIQCPRCTRNMDPSQTQQTKCSGCGVQLSHTAVVEKIQCPSCKTITDVRETRKRSWMLEQQRNANSLSSSSSTPSSSYPRNVRPSKKYKETPNPQPLLLPRQQLQSQQQPQQQDFTLGFTYFMRRHQPQYVSAYPQFSGAQIHAHLVKSWEGLPDIQKIEFQRGGVNWREQFQRQYTQILQRQQQLTSSGSHQQLSRPQTNGYAVNYANLQAQKLQYQQQLLQQQRPRLQQQQQEEQQEEDDVQYIGSPAEFGVMEAKDGSTVVLCPVCQHYVSLLELNAHVEAHAKQTAGDQLQTVLPPVKSWNCSKCTYLNQKYGNFCEICNTPKSLGPEEQRELKERKRREEEQLRDTVAKQQTYLKKYKSCEIEKMKCFVKNSFSDSHAFKELVSLICPVSQSIITLPAKGTLCSHLTDFDLETHLLRAQTQTKNPHKAWLCPICQKMCGLEELYIDTLMIEILDSVPSDTTEIFLKPDGSWTPIQPEKSKDSDRVVIDLTGDGPVDVGFCPIVKKEKPSMESQKLEMPKKPRTKSKKPVASKKLAKKSKNVAAKTKKVAIKSKKGTAKNLPKKSSKPVVVTNGTAAQAMNG